MLIDYFKLIRPYQWVKNFFCLSGIIFGLHFTESNFLIPALIAFSAFCLTASAVYFLNDIIDIAEDRSHSKKRYRTIASVKIGITQAYSLFALLLCLGLILSLFAGKYLFLVILTYVLLNIYYTKTGKHIDIFDDFINSIGYLLRVFAGTHCNGIPLSAWLTLCVIALTLFLGFSKRRAELLACEISHQNKIVQRRVLEQYEPNMLNIFIAITASASILSYALFIVISHPYSPVVCTIIFVIYGIFRYIYLLYSHTAGQDTANDLLDDKHLIIVFILWVITYVEILQLS